MMPRRRMMPHRRMAVLKSILISKRPVGTHGGA